MADSSFVYVESESERINQLETERITFTDTIDELQSLLNHKNTALDILQVIQATDTLSPGVFNNRVGEHGLGVVSTYPHQSQW